MMLKITICDDNVKDQKQIADNLRVYTTRPDTLFGTKFESYLNQKPRAKPQAPNYSIDNSNLGITEEDIERYLK